MGVILIELNKKTKRKIGATSGVLPFFAYLYRE